MQDTDELDRITEQQDRSATFELIRKLTDLDAGGVERDRIVYALGQIADPRAALPLTDIARDLDRPAEVRQAALQALADSSMSPEGAELRDWWNTGDDLIRAWALRQAERTEADLLEPIARDPHHPMHRDALAAIAVRFDEPRWQQYKIAGLDHPDPAVRRTAAYILGWDEPIAAEPALHRAAGDSDPDVACAAIDSLRYYSTRATLRLLHEIAQGDGEAATAARASEADLLDDFEQEQSRISEWIAPVADLLSAPNLDPTPASTRQGPLPRPTPSALSASEIFTTYSDPEGPWAPKLTALRSYNWSDSWSTIPATDRPALAAFLAGHPDLQVRALCCSALSGWHETDLLLALAHDQEMDVRQSAIYNLRFVPPSAEISTLTWDLVASGRIAGTPGCEALATCSAHTPPGVLDDRLIDLACNDLRENIRTEAVSLLGERVEPLLPLLAEPPSVTWAVHVVLLFACQSSGLRPPAANALRTVDNLHIALALADLFDT